MGVLRREVFPGGGGSHGFAAGCLGGYHGGQVRGVAPTDPLGSPALLIQGLVDRLGPALVVRCLLLDLLLHGEGGALFLHGQGVLGLLLLLLLRGDLLVGGLVHWLLRLWLLVSLWLLLLVAMLLRSLVLRLGSRGVRPLLQWRLE